MLNIQKAYARDLDGEYEYIFMFDDYQSYAYE
jgi:hypothetical protein